MWRQIGKQSCFSAAPRIPISPYLSASLPIYRLPLRMRARLVSAGGVAGLRTAGRRVAAGLLVLTRLLAWFLGLALLRCVILYRLLDAQTADEGLDAPVHGIDGHGRRKEHMCAVDVLLDIEVLGILDTLRMETHTECSQSVDLHAAAALEHLVHFEHQGADNSQDVRLGDGTPVADAQGKLLDAYNV